MRDYVQFNSLCRSQAQNDFDINFYKLLSNSLFGKTIENPEKRTKVKLCRMKEELESNIGKPTFKRSKIIDQHLVGVEMKYASVKLNKPYYVGVAILELAKHHMYDFHYNVMKSVFEGCLHLLYTDMDSLLYEIEDCSDPYSEIFAAGHGSHFDLSNFPQEHWLHDVSHKCVPGTFKDECGGPRTFPNLWACVAKCTVCSLTTVPHKHAQSPKWRRVSKVALFRLVSFLTTTFVACWKTR